MGNLARRRGARDIWVSRGQLWAAGASIAFLAVCCFGLGVAWGTETEAETKGAVSPSFRGELASLTLVDLLARVEAGTDPTGAVGRLTFPKELAAANAALNVPDALAQPSVRVGIETAGEEQPDVPLPAGLFTVELSRFSSESEAGSYRVSLLEHGVQVELIVEHVSGVPSYRLVSGSFDDEDSAAVHIGEVEAATSALGFTPQVMPVR